MAESIGDLMTANPRSLESGSTVMEASRPMRDEHAGLIPVVDGEKLVGVSVTIDPQQELGEAQARSSRARPRRKQAVPAECQPGQLSYFRM
jgi:predicted transcriptional regulator